jgi:tetratricopeptide (TPR) repeat protein
MNADETRESKNWKVQKEDGSRLEPANLAVLRQWVSSHQVGPDDLIINDGLSDWIRAAEVIELFDLFEKRESPTQPDAPSAPSQETLEFEVETPDCAFHPGRASVEICVGCGKFICGECGERFESKLYCRRCLAEKQVGAEPGAPAGPGAIAQIIPGVRPAGRLNRFSLAGIVFSGVALVSSFLMLSPGLRIAASPVVGFIAFLGALMGAVGLSNIRSAQSARSKQFALAGLLVGLSILILSIWAVSISIKEFKSASGEKLARRNEGWIVPQEGRRQAPLSGEAKGEREANAQQLLDQVVKNLNERQLEQAVSAARTLIGLYPETEAGRRAEQSLPALEQALADRQAQDKELIVQNEELARQRLEHAMQFIAEGNRGTAADLLKSVLEGYPETKAAASAKEELAKLEGAVAAQRMEKQEQEASQIARRAKEHMEAEQYAQAVELYTRLLDNYPSSSAAASARTEYERARLLLNDPSEREFHKIAARMPEQTYEETIEGLQDFLARNPDSARFEQAKAMLQENQAGKLVADGLFTFGSAYFSEQKYKLALGRYEKLIEEHPRSQWVPQARKDREKALEKLKE